MELHLTPEQEAQLSSIATHAGKNAEQILQEAVDRLIEEDARFRDAVRRGIASADRGDLLDHEEVVARIEQLFNP